MVSLSLSSPCFGLAQHFESSTCSQIVRQGVLTHIHTYFPGDLCDANAASDEWNPSDRLDSDVLAFSVHKEAQSEEAHTPLSSQKELGAGIALVATLAEERQLLKAS